jgi:hypothetical protein
MMDRATLLEFLGRCEDTIATGDQRILQQTDLVVDRLGKGLDLTQALVLLDELRRFQAGRIAHRRQLLGQLRL